MAIGSVGVGEVSLTPKKPRGFAAMSEERRREIASKGGHAAQATGKTHRYTSAEAKVAGAKGGKIIAQRPGHMAELGRRGGMKSAERRNKSV